MPRTLSEADADLFYQLFFPLLGSLRLLGFLPPRGENRHESKQRNAQ